MSANQWQVRDFRWREKCTITGDTLERAVADNLKLLVSVSRQNDSMATDVRLEKLFFSPGIFCGNGGAVAEISYYDEVYKKRVAVQAWIYTDANFAPVEPSER